MSAEQVALACRESLGHFPELLSIR
jgi:hypothetical protein